MTDRPLQCNIKNPVALTIGDHKNEFHSGCRVVDITFPNIVNPEVGEIHFKNHYVAFLTVKVKFKPSADNGEPPGEARWKTCIKKMRLMPNPHTETGSQDYFCINKKHATVRLILQQPSPVWKEFRTPPLPAWLIEDSANNSHKKKLEGIPNIEAISSNLQQLWALSEEVSTHQTDTQLGRYD
ncbi:hypothetical protein KUTeg_021295, partial [Tegillarca granosa]